MFEQTPGTPARTRKIWRDGAWVAAGQAAIALGGFAALKLLTSLLRVEDYGRFALMLGLVALGSSLFLMPVLQAVLRFYPAALAKGSVGALRGMARHRLLRSIGLSCLLFALGGASWWLAADSSVPLSAYLLAAAFLAADAVRGLEMSLLNADRRQMDHAVRGAADAWARPLLAGVAILLLGSGPVPVLLAYVAGSLLVSLVLRNRTVRGDRAPDRWEDDAWANANRGAFLQFALPLLPLAALNWVMSLGDRYILGGISGVQAVGTYAAAYALASQPIMAANQLVHSTLRPVLYDAVARGDRPKERRVLRIWLALAAGLAVAAAGACALLAPWLTRVLLGPDFAGARVLLPWIALAYGLQSVQQTFEVMMFAHAQTRRLVLLQAIAAGVALVLYFLLIPKYGALGAAWGTLGTMGVTTLVAAALASAPRRLLPGTPAGVPALSKDPI